MANKGRDLSENELQLSSGGKITVDRKKSGEVIGAHLWGNINGEDQGYFSAADIKNGALEEVARAWGTSLDVVENRPGDHSGDLLSKLKGPEKKAE